MSLISSMPLEEVLIDVNKVNIPDEGLGNFRFGYTQETVSFNWSCILWNLLPLVGQILFLFHVITYLWTKSHANRILLYEHGFIKQVVDMKGRVKKESVYDFYKINGVKYSKTRQYQNIYGIQRYNCTAVSLHILGSDNAEELIIKGSYRNENELDNQYNFVGYACNSIRSTWLQFAIDKFNKEISTVGYGTFVSKSGRVLVGKEFIQVNDQVVSPGFKYSFDSGYLYLYPNDEEGSHFKKKSKSVNINVVEMYNSDVFLMAMQQFFGISC